MEFIELMHSCRREIIGYCRSGPAEGLYLRATPIATGGVDSEYWDLAFAGIIESEDIFPEDIVSISMDSPGDREFLSLLNAERVPEPWASRVRISLFPPHPPIDRTPSVWDGTGRFYGSMSLEYRLAMLERMATESHKTFASGSRFTISEMRSLVHEHAGLLDSLSFYLAAFGLSFSIVPASATVPEHSAEPWREYGGL